MESDIQLRTDTLSNAVEDLVRTASDHPVIRNKMRYLGGDSKYEPNTMKASFYPPFGTAHHPICAGEYDEAQDFYGEYELDRPNTGISSVASAGLLSKNANYSEPTPYTHRDEGQWQTRIEQGHIPQPLDIKMHRR